VAGLFCLVGFFKGDLLQKKNLLLCTAFAHPCMWIVCSLAQKFAKARSLELKECPLVTSVFEVWIHVKKHSWQSEIKYSSQQGWRCILHWNASVAWLTWGMSSRLQIRAEDAQQSLGVC